MPVIVPIVIAVAAYAASAAVVSAFALVGFAALAVGAVVGAVVGAAVGAIGAAIQGQDIGEGALWGAVGGAVAGGFAGYMSDGGASSTAAGSSESMASTGVKTGVYQSSTGEVVTGAGTTSEIGASSSLMDGMGAAAVTTGGSMISNYAKGEAGAESNADAIAAAEKERKETFEQRMKEIQANHESSMASINEQTSAQMALADKNNQAAMDQLNTRIGAEKAATDAAYGREDAKIAGFNESIRGTDENLFTRPTFKFDTGAGNGNTVFDSEFAKASGQSPNAAPQATPQTAATSPTASEPVITITPEQLQEIKAKQATATA